jgi:hypothetical protein
MTHREVRSGAAIAGAILCALPFADMLLDPGRFGALHLVVGVMGALLMLSSLAGGLS